MMMMMMMEGCVVVVKKQLMFCVGVFYCKNESRKQSGR
jgi:hypothetical protein